MAMKSSCRSLEEELLSVVFPPFTAGQVFDCFSDLVYFVKNARGQYVVINQALAVRCRKSDKSEVIGRTPDEVYPHPLGLLYRAQDQRVLRTGEPILNRLELQICRTGGPGWCVTNKLPLRDVHGQIVGLVGFSRDLQTPNERGEDYSRVAEAVCFLQDHYGEPIRVRSLAARAGLSTYQFDQRIRRIFHITAGQFILKVRMDAAERQLRETGDPIADIAQQCGYSDQSAFTRQFRQTVGLSPAQYRRRAGGEMAGV